MREINFSVPSSNRASVGITTALYDRRALDCTSTLPLINSLNHLAYLTTSSARIREILTVDGGVERLVNILKHGRNKDMLDTWKWNLAFQCLVNIGVRGSDGKGGESRGSENIRTRVVEADVVPVIATILDNYIQVVDGVQANCDEDEINRSCSKHASSKQHMHRSDEPRESSRTMRLRRREAPPPINIPPTILRPAADRNEQPQLAHQRVVPSSPPHDQPLGLRPLHHHHHHHHHRHHHHHDRSRDSSPRRHNRHESVETPTTMASASDNRTDQRLRASTWAAPPSPRPADVSLMPPMTAGLHAEISSQPDTPTTPRASNHMDEPMREPSPSHLAVPHRPGIRRHVSMSGLSDDDDQDIMPVDNRQTAEEPANVPAIGLTEEMEIEQLADRASILDTTDRAENLMPAVNGEPDMDGFNLTRTGLDGSIIDQLAGAAARAEAAVGMSPVTQFQDADARGATSPLTGASPVPRGATPGTWASVPQEGDVVLSLQLLAYVSKYCNLRPYFQQCHLVPRLKIQNELKLMKGDAESIRQVEEDDDNEFCQSQNYNIFPLVEKFTVRTHPSEMRYWAGVVMRNLCRKDKTRGDIRQCAYYKCGKWEEYPRQFAKCRRCRQTKYCSKDCQKNAWLFHRHWCQIPTTPGAGQEGRS